VGGRECGIPTTGSSGQLGVLIGMLKASTMPLMTWPTDPWRLTEASKSVHSRAFLDGQSARRQWVP
jgi:hypothetical protein